MRALQPSLAAFLVGNFAFNVATLFLRLFAGGMMLTHGIGKIMNFETLVQSFPDPIGLGSAMTLTLITTVEVAFSAFLIIGLFTRLSAIPLIVAMSVAAFLTYPAFSLTHSELAIIYLGVYVAIFLVGPGKFSVDYLIARYDGKK